MQIQRYTSSFQGYKYTHGSTSQPQGQGSKVTESGTIYHYKCPHLNCPEAYIGESGKALGNRVSEHFKAPYPIYIHSASTGHPLDPDCFNIIHKERHNNSRTIKEAMFIRVNDPKLNRKLEKYQLLHVWHSILQATPMLQLKPSSLPSLPIPLPPPTRISPPTQSTSTPTTPLPLTPGGGHMYISW